MTTKPTDPSAAPKPSHQQRKAIPKVVVDPPPTTQPQPQPAQVHLKTRMNATKLPSNLSPSPFQQQPSEPFSPLNHFQPLAPINLSPTYLSPPVPTQSYLSPNTAYPGLPSQQVQPNYPVFSPSKSFIFVGEIVQETYFC